MTAAIPGFHFDHNLREIPDNRSEWETYLSSLREGLEAAKTDEEKLPLFETAGFVARVLMSLEAAECYLNKALVLSYQNPSKNRLVQNLIRLAHVLQWQREFHKSHMLFSQALALMYETEVPSALWASYHQHRGKLFFDQDYHALAAGEFALALHLRAQIAASRDLIQSSETALNESMVRGKIKRSASTVVRRAYLSDAQGIHEAHMKSIQEICSRDHSPEEIRAWGHRPYRADLRQNSIKNDEVWVVERNGVIEGYAHLKLDFRGAIKKAHVFGLYITPKVLGQGFGKILMDTMLEKVKLSEAVEINLESTLSSIEFYKKAGFTENGPQTSVVMAGVPIRCIPMKRVLA